MYWPRSGSRLNPLNGKSALYIAGERGVHLGRVSEVGKAVDDRDASLWISIPYFIRNIQL